MAGDKSESLDYSVNLSSEIHEGSSEEDIKILQRLIPENGQEIFEFYKSYNGVKLFCNKETVGVEFFKANEFVAENEGWKELCSEIDENELCNFEKYGVAFGTIPNSGNYFILYEGKVYYSNHDDMNDSPVTESFNEFLLQIATDPADFLYKMGCYTRYSDGKTDSQWIPKEFACTS